MALACLSVCWRAAVKGTSAVMLTHLFGRLQKRSIYTRFLKVPGKNYRANQGTLTDRKTRTQLTRFTFFAKASSPKTMLKEVFCFFS